MTAMPEVLPERAVRAPGIPLAAVPGRVLGLAGPPGSGLTRLGLGLAAGAASGPVAVVDVRGWLCPLGAWESGIAPDRLVVVRCPDRDMWPRVTAALLDGLRSVYAEVPAGVPDQVLRRLGALARNRRAALVLRPLRGGLPGGLTHLHLTASGVTWDGTDAGHGRLTGRRLALSASGRGTGGIERTVEVEDDGTNPVRLVPGLATPARRRAAG
jgi:hypothetical protein